MISINASVLNAIEQHATHDFPHESCGLLIGKINGQEVHITRHAPSANLAQDTHDAFEIDPALHLALQREVRAAGESIVGVYHSHPAGVAYPSATDIANVQDEKLLWFITKPEASACETKCFLIISAQPKECIFRCV